MCPNITYTIWKGLLIAFGILISIFLAAYFFYIRGENVYSNKEAATLVNPELTKLLTSPENKWNLRNLSIIVLNYASKDDIEQIFKLNCAYRDNIN